MDLLLCNSYFLVNDPIPGARGQPYAPLGILYLASYLRQFREYDVGVFDATFADGLLAFERTLQLLRPRVVGIQGLITTRNAAKQMIEIAKNRNAVVVMGGPDPSCSWEDYLRWGADYVVVGEGEIALHQLMVYLSQQSADMTLDEIPGLVYLRNGCVYRTALHTRITDLDTIPFPAYELIDVERYLDAWSSYNGYTSMHLLTSRGCPFNCNWCSHAVFGRTFRQRSIENVIAEMKFLRDRYNPDHLTIGDDTFGLNKKWLNCWCTAVKEAGFSFTFRCFSRVDVVDKQMVGQLKSIGCSHIHLGVESGSQRVLNGMNKGTHVEDIYRASRLIKDAGIGLGYFIMFAYPGETFDDIHMTERLIFDVKPDTLGISIAYPVPGTDFYERVKDQLLRAPSGREEQMGSGRQLRFKAAYPDYYYRWLIRYIDNRSKIYLGEGFLLSRIVRGFLAASYHVLLRVFERVWSLISR